MLGILAPLFTRRREPPPGGLASEVRSPAAPSAGAIAQSIESRIEARNLCDALDRALELGLLAHADRLASSAAQLAVHHPSLCERLTRLRLAQSDPETALGILASCRKSTASLRLLRCACLVQTGRKSQAHSDLLRWSRRATAPIDARLMLALLEWDAGDLHAAALTLVRNLKHLEDPRSLELLILVAARQSRFDQAQRWAERLRTCVAGTEDDYAAQLFCLSLGLHSPRSSQMAGEEQIATLALELVSAEAVIPALVHALALEFNPDAAALLLAAIERALPDLGDPSAANEAVHRLRTLLADNRAVDEFTSDVIGRIGGIAASDHLVRGEAA